MSIQDIMTVVLVVSMMAVGLGSFVFIQTSENVALKKKVWPMSVIGWMVLFIGFVWHMGTPAKAYLILVPFAVVAVIFWIKRIDYCNACGRTIWRSKPFARTIFCPSCGARLDGKGDQAVSEE